MNYTLIGIIIVSVIAYFIGRLSFTIIGNGSRGILGNIFWGCIIIAVCTTKHLVLIPAFFLIFILVFKS